MITRSWVRAGALLGAVGGGLRAVGSFAPMILASDAPRRWLYGAIDVCLIAGLASIYVPRRRRMTVAGTLGFFLASGGLLALRTNTVLASPDVYPFTAGAIGIGVLVLSLTESAASRIGAWIPVAFAGSLVLGGAGAFLPGAGGLFVASGVLFGVAFTAMALTSARPSRLAR
jgi:hypothetical protein